MVITETVMKVIPEVHQIANRYLRAALLFTVLLAIPSLCHAWLGKWSMSLMAIPSTLKETARKSGFVYMALTHLNQHKRLGKTQ